MYHYNDVNCQDWRRIRSKLGKHNIKLKVVPVKLTAKVSLKFYSLLHGIIAYFPLECPVYF